MNWQETREALIEAGISVDKLPDDWQPYIYLRLANLSGANLSGADLSGADLRVADLSLADLIEADLSLANLSGANLSGANLSLADLSLANLSGADLSGANLSWANLTEVGLSLAKFSGVTTYHTAFATVDLSGVKGLDEVDHLGPSTIGIDTIYRSGGNIPESFLRGCGVPDTFIAFTKSLVGTAIEFYSAFISYSSGDDELARRVYSDLQTEGVRCWLAPEDLKIGDKFRLAIEDSIRLHDKLLLILSKQSITSKWVKYEVENALDREVEQDKLILFPIRIDNAVMETDVEWAARIKRTRHIGDFTSWKDHDIYQAAFDRLLRDLQEGED